MPWFISSKLLMGASLCLLVALYASTPGNDTTKIEPKSYNQCCDYPCENDGICMSKQDGTYQCDCTLTGYLGANCHIPTRKSWLIKLLKPSPEGTHKTITSYPWLWAVINRIPFLQKAIMKYVYLSRGDIVDSPNRYESDHSYITLDAFFNETYFGRELPPVPKDCPTPMGSKGFKELPSVKEVFDEVLLRRKFKPEPHNINLLFQYYAQHFTHQFFRTDYSKEAGKMTKGSVGVDVSNIYGLTEEIRQGLRSHVDGKLITQTIDGDQYPPYLKDVPAIKMDYPPHLPIPEETKFALGHPFFALLPALFAYSTIWVREHNRVCDVLKEENPHWDDEQLYHTARLIITGEVIKITIEDYVQALSQYNFRLTFDPELVHNTPFQFHNRIKAEFKILYHWHPLVADGLNIDETYYPLESMAFSTKAVFTHGIDKFVEALTKERAGQLTSQNIPPLVEPVITKSLTLSREMRIQPFNQYRKRFGMKPFKSFEELTGEKELAKTLERLYGDIDAVEWYIGLISEQTGASITPLTMVNVGGPWSVKGLVSNPICSPRFWKPSTFGGEKGFEIVKTATLEKLFCQNLKNKCKGFKLSLKVPEGTPFK